jgi:SAM-dependent methyltransferase
MKGLVGVVCGLMVGASWARPEHKQVIRSDCGPVVEEAARVFEGSPPKEMPEDWRNAYTMEGRAILSDYYVDDTNQGKGTHYGYSESEMEGLISEGKMVRSWPTARKLQTPGVGLTAVALDRIADRMENASVVVYGSMTPRFEALALAYGARKVTTLEFNTLTFAHPQVRTVRVDEWRREKLDQREKFDVGLSITSFDHTGLGRYGDPLHPDGDILAMREALDDIRPGGTLLLTVPVGPDAIAWNLHRRYGIHRLPRLLQGWSLFDTVSYDPRKVAEPASVTRSYEPVFLLRRPDTPLPCTSPIRHITPLLLPRPDIPSPPPPSEL